MGSLEELLKAAETTSITPYEVGWGEFWLTTIHDGLLVMHDGGLSWGLTIPLATILVRFCAVGWIQRWTHEEKRRLVTVQPYLSAFAQVMARRDLEAGKDKINVKTSLRLWQANVMNRFGASRWRAQSTPLLQLPIWFAFVETLRSMAGAPYGIFGMMLRSLQLVDPAIEEGVAGRSILFPQLIEPSMAKEGLLWFTDLTAPDPYYALSFILAGITWANVQYMSRGLATSQKYTGLSERQRGSRIIEKFMKWLPLALVPVTTQFPAAILLYWSTSALSGLGMNMLLVKVRPIKKIVSPCTRGLEHLEPHPRWLIDMVKKTRIRGDPGLNSSRR